MGIAPSSKKKGDMKSDLENMDTMELTPKKEKSGKKKIFGSISRSKMDLDSIISSKMDFAKTFAFSKSDGAAASTLKRFFGENQGSLLEASSSFNHKQFNSFLGDDDSKKKKKKVRVNKIFRNCPIINRNYRVVNYLKRDKVFVSESTKLEVIEEQTEERPEEIEELKEVCVYSLTSKKHFKMKIIDLSSLSFQEKVVLKEFQETIGMNSSYLVNNVDIVQLEYSPINKEKKGNYLVVVSEYFEDSSSFKTLLSFIEGSKVFLTGNALVSWFLQILKCYSFVSSSKGNCVHGALSPRNLILYNLNLEDLEKVRIKLSDLKDCFTVTDQVVEEEDLYLWRSPEYDREAVKSTDDIWSLGMIFFQIAFSISNKTLKGTIDKLIMDILDSKELKKKLLEDLKTKEVNPIHDRRKIINYIFRKELFKKYVFDQKGVLDIAMYDFIEKLLRVDPKKRYSAKRLLGHPISKTWKYIFGFDEYKEEKSEKMFQEKKKILAKDVDLFAVITVLRTLDGDDSDVFDNCLDLLCDSIGMKSCAHFWVNSRFTKRLVLFLFRNANFCQKNLHPFFRIIVQVLENNEDLIRRVSVGLRTFRFIDNLKEMLLFESNYCLFKLLYILNISCKTLCKTFCDSLFVSLFKKYLGLFKKSNDLDNSQDENEETSREKERALLEKILQLWVCSINSFSKIYKIVKEERLELLYKLPTCGKQFFLAFDGDDEMNIENLEIVTRDLLNLILKEVSWLVKSSFPWKEKNGKIDLCLKLLKFVFLDSEDSDQSDLVLKLFEKNEENFLAVVSEDDNVDQNSLCTMSEKNLFVEVIHANADVKLSSDDSFCVFVPSKDSKSSLEDENITVGFYEVEIVEGGSNESIQVGVLANTVDEADYRWYLLNPEKGVLRSSDSSKLLKVEDSFVSSSGTIIGCGVNKMGKLFFTVNGKVIPTILNLHLTDDTELSCFIRVEKNAGLQFRMNFGEKFKFPFRNSNQGSVENEVKQLFSKVLRGKKEKTTSILDLLFKMKTKLSEETISLCSLLKKRLISELKK